MATPIDQISLNELAPTIKALAKAGGTTDCTDWIRSRGNAALLIQFINQQRGMPEKNPYEMTVEAQLTALRRANDEEKWGITKKDFSRLASTAPAWPQGKHAYRSFRIRFGEGDEGIAKTFEAHYLRNMRVHGIVDFWPWDLEDSNMEHCGSDRLQILAEELRLLNGNDTHHACVEWIVADLDTHRERDSVRYVRDSKSLADELFVIAWMFPDMIRAIDHAEFPALFAAGYEYNHDSDEGDKAYNRRVVSVDVAYVSDDDGELFVCDEPNDHNCRCYSVPRLL